MWGPCPTAGRIVHVKAVLQVTPAAPECLEMLSGCGPWLLPQCWKLPTLVLPCCLVSYQWCSSFRCFITGIHLLENRKATVVFLTTFCSVCFTDKGTRYCSEKYTWAHPTRSNGLLFRKLWTWKVFWDFSWRIWYSRSHLEQWNEVNNQLLICI